jgi:AraC family transcriptional regulator
MSKPLSILQGRFGRVALLEMDRSLVTHAHRDCHALLKFSGADTAFDVRSQICPLTDESAVLVNAWEPHAYTHGENAPRTLILALYIDPTWLGGIDSRLLCSGHSQFFPRSCVAITPEIRESTRSLGEQMMLGNILTTQDAEQAVFKLMIRLIDAFSDRKVLRTDPVLLISDHRIRRVVCHMRKTYGQPLNIETLSRVAGLSRPHFFSLFKSNTGLTPALFLNTLRMEAATHILIDTKEPLSDVALDLGFDAHSNFTRFFRQHQGVTPSEYRRTTQFFG